MARSRRHPCRACRSHRRLSFARGRRIIHTSRAGTPITIRHRAYDCARTGSARSNARGRSVWQGDASWRWIRLRARAYDGASAHRGAPEAWASDWCNSASRRRVGRSRVGAVGADRVRRGQIAQRQRRDAIGIHAIDLVHGQVAADGGRLDAAERAAAEPSGRGRLDLRLERRRGARLVRSVCLSPVSQPGVRLPWAPSQTRRGGSRSSPIPVWRTLRAHGCAGQCDTRTTRPVTDAD